MSLGAVQAGIDVALAVESNPHAARTYRANQKGTRVFDDDIANLTSTCLKTWKNEKQELIVFGGPPCQGFSWSNTRTRNTRNASNWLFEEFLRVVGELRPTWVVFENVQGIVSTAQGVFLSRVIESLKEDYLLHQAVLNSVHYGVPQSRSRFFLVGSKHGIQFQFPKKISSHALTVDDAIRDLPALRNGASVCRRHYGRTKPSEYGKKLRGSVAAVCCNHLVTKSSPLILKRYKHVPQGGNWSNIPESLMRNYTERTRCHTGIYHRLRSDHESIVIGNFRKNMLIHPTQNRGLSVREAARIQSFPDSYTFYGSIGFQQQQVGNAVPPLLAKSVFQAILQSAKR